MLAGLKGAKFDAIMAVPEWQSKGVAQGFGHSHLRCPGREGMEPRVRRPIPVTVGYVLKETIEKSPDLVQGYVTPAIGQQWIRKAKDEEVVELLQKPYMSTYSRDEILESVRYYRTIFDWTRHRREGLRAGHEGVGASRCREADPLQTGGGHVVRQEGAGEAQVVSRVRIAIRDLSKTFHQGPREICAVSGVTFDVHDREFVAVVGPSAAASPPSSI